MAFVRAAVVRLDLQDEAVEVVLGGGIFDTDDTAFHARVAAGVHAAAPRAVLVRLDAPPVLGAALIGLDADGRAAEPRAALRQALDCPDSTPEPGRRVRPPSASRDAGRSATVQLSRPAAAAPRPAGTCGMASATRRSSSASSEWARSFTISMISGCSSGFQPSSSSVSPLRRASVSFSSAVVPAGVR